MSHCTPSRPRRLFLKSTLASLGLGALATPAKAMANWSTVLDAARAGLERTAGRAPLRDVVGVADFAQPSGAPRLHLVDLASGRIDTLLVAHGRAAAAAREAFAAMPEGWNSAGLLRSNFLSPLAQPDYDHLLWASDLNFVRGEDSLVRALWAGAGLVWQAYPQHDEAHAVKVRAFLDWLEPPESLRRFNLRWNGAETGELPAALECMRADRWGEAVREARGRLWAQADLVSRLLRFVAERR